jgi:hypothetical protein
MPGQRRHVTQRPGGQWADKAEGAEREGGLHNTQAEAQAAATQHLQNQPGGGEVVIHRHRHGCGATATDRVRLGNQMVGSR